MLSLCSCKSLHKTYNQEVDHERRDNSMENVQIITESDIANLPEPVRNYFRYTGFLGQPMPYNCTIDWEDVEFKMGPEKEWIPIKCLQFNSVKEPARFAYLYAPKMRINMFVGRDKYQQGKGNMHIKLLGLFTIQNAWGKAMDESSLVTILSETLFVPGYALQQYVKWEEVDLLSAKATITHNGISVSGTFYFNEKGEMTHFTSLDRNYVDTDGNEQKIEWVANVEYYIQQDGLTVPGYVSATWKNRRVITSILKEKLRH